MGAPRRPVSADTVHDVVLINPLGGALHHYTRQLLQTLQSSELQVRALTLYEPSLSGGSRVKWLRDYVAALLSVRGSSARVLVTWPVLGHIDRLLVPLLTGDRRGAVIMHDPRPLVRAVGYGPIATWLAKRVADSGTFLVHSVLAQKELLAQGVRADVVPHPIIASAIPRRVSGTPIIRVLGQWKPDRDLNLLTALAELLPEVTLEIVGRGWPSVRGWNVRDEFVSEDELDSLIATSSAVLIPYRRYYQSGIAARSLEMAVPVVGRRLELEPMTGASYPYLVETPDLSDWADRVKAAVTSEQTTLERVRREVAGRALESWQTWGRS